MLLFSFPLYLTDTTKKTLPLLQPHVGKAMPTAWYPRMQCYLSHIEIRPLTHLLLELKCNKEFPPSYIPLPSSLWSLLSP